MADLNTAQRVAFTVTDFNGNVVPEPLSVAVTGTAAHDTIVDGQRYLVADEAGSATITVSKDGQSGTVVVTVEAAPLTISFGTPEPK